MDRIKQFQQAIIELLNEYKGQFHQTNQEVWAETVIDDTNHHYQFLWTGWRGERHIFSVVFHIDILGEKIHIQQDNTEIGIANLLLEKGINKQEIVLAYFPKAHRPYTDFAVA